MASMLLAAPAMAQQSPYDGDDFVTRPTASNSAPAHARANAEASEQARRQMETDQLETRPVGARPVGTQGAVFAQTSQTVSQAPYQSYTQSPAQPSVQPSVQPSRNPSPNTAYSYGARPPQNTAPTRGNIGTAGQYSAKVLSSREHVNTKPLIQLQALGDALLDDTVTLSGNVFVVGNYQRSNTDSKFSYLERHPTSTNQVGKTTHEVALSEANIAITASVEELFTGYVELTYNPQKSFGSGTIIDINRNQIALARGWVMAGNLEKSPFYALAGKVDIPFGLNDTVSPFTHSNNWHAFSGLAYGAQAGYYGNGFHARAMLVQGGAQFRAANTPVNGTNVPSKANNFAVDLRYGGHWLDRRAQLMVGASYLHGSAYCQNFPVIHFKECDDNNPAIAGYGRIGFYDLTVLAEYATTLDVWPGSANPDSENPLSVFEPVKTQAFTVGSRYGFGRANDTITGRPFAISAEFSRFIAGQKGAPWERQDQTGLGFSWMPDDRIKLFSEVVVVDGFVPLNFLSGGNVPDGSTWSERDAETKVGLLGAKISF